MTESSELYQGDPVYGDELDSVIQRIEKGCNNYKVQSLEDADTVREDFGVGVYWDQGGKERFVLVTAYDKNKAYLSVGARKKDNREEVIELGFVNLEDLEPHLEAAGSTAESMNEVF